MSATVKKWINRGGLAAMALGVILIIVAGGDPEAAMSTVGVIAEVVGVLIVALREILN